MQRYFALDATNSEPGGFARGRHRLFDITKALSIGSGSPLRNEISVRSPHHGFLAERARAKRPAIPGLDQLTRHNERHTPRTEPDDTSQDSITDAASFHSRNADGSRFWLSADDDV
jgi:hypothetical protein